MPRGTSTRVIETFCLPWPALSAPKPLLVPGPAVPEPGGAGALQNPAGRHSWLSAHGGARLPLPSPPSKERSWPQSLLEGRHPPQPRLPQVRLGPLLSCGPAGSGSAPGRAEGLETAGDAGGGCGAGADGDSRAGGAGPGSGSGPGGAAGGAGPAGEAGAAAVPARRPPGGAERRRRRRRSAAATSGPGRAMPRRARGRRRRRPEPRGAARGKRGAGGTQAGPPRPLWAGGSGQAGPGVPRRSQGQSAAGRPRSGPGVSVRPSVRRGRAEPGLGSPQPPRRLGQAVGCQAGEPPAVWHPPDVPHPRAPPWPPGSDPSP